MITLSDIMCSELMGNPLRIDDSITIIMVDISLYTYVYLRYLSHESLHL